MISFINKAVVVACISIASSTSAYAAEFITHTYKDKSGDIYETRDGTIFKKTGYGYVGYMGYGSEVAFIEDEICMNGSRYRYDLYEVGSRYHYSINTYTGAEAYEKFEEICGG